MAQLKALRCGDNFLFQCLCIHKLMCIFIVCICMCRMKLGSVKKLNSSQIYNGGTFLGREKKNSSQGYKILKLEETLGTIQFKPLILWLGKLSPEQPRNSFQAQQLLVTELGWSPDPHSGAP